MQSSTVLQEIHERLIEGNAYQIVVQQKYVSRKYCTSYFLEPRVPSIPPMCLRLGNTSLRSEHYPNAYREHRYPGISQKPAMKTAYELHWGLSTVPPSKHHACPDFMRFYFSGIPSSEAEKLLLFLHGWYSVSMQYNLQQKMRAYCVKYDDTGSALAGLVDFDWGNTKRDSYSYHFILPWMEYMEEHNIPFEGRGATVRSFYGRFLKKLDFDRKIPAFANGVGLGDLQPRDLKPAEMQSEAEWGVKRGTLAAATTEGELQPRQVAQRTERIRSIRQSMLAQEEHVRRVGDEVRQRAEHENRERRREARRQRRVLYIHSNDLLEDYSHDDENEYLLPELAHHFYNKVQLSSAAKREIQKWQQSEKVRGLMDNEGNPMIPKGSQGHPIRLYSAVLARAFTRLVGPSSNIRFATFELNYNLRDLDPETKEARFEETCFKPFREKYPHAKDFLKRPQTKEHLYKLLHVLVLTFLKEFADPNRPHACIISLEPSMRKWNGIRIPHAHVLFLLPWDNLREEKVMWEFNRSIGLKFKSNYWITAAARAFLSIDPEYYSVLLMILYLLKCQCAHVERLSTREWREDLFRANIAHTQFFPIHIQIGERHVIREIFDDPALARCCRVCFRNIESASRFSQPQCLLSQPDSISASSTRMSRPAAVSGAEQEQDTEPIAVNAEEEDEVEPMIIDYELFELEPHKPTMHKNDPCKQYEEVMPLEGY